MPPTSFTFGLTDYAVLAGYLLGMLALGLAFSGGRLRSVSTTMQAGMCRGGRWGLPHLWQGEFEAGGSATMPEKTITVQAGERVSLMVGPRQA